MADQTNTATASSPQAEQTTAQATQQQSTEKTYTFSQTELDALVGRRVAKATKDMPTAEELAAFRTWKESQQTEQQRFDAMKNERDTAQTELVAARQQIEQFEREKILVSKGVSADDVDYYAFKIGKLVTETKSFEQAATEFFAATPPRGAARVDFGAPLSGGNKSNNPNDQMNALIRGARK